MSHTETDIVKSLLSQSVTDVSFLSAAVNKHSQVWEEYIKALTTQLNKLIARNKTLLITDKITQKIITTWIKQKLKSFSFKLSMCIYSNKLIVLSLLNSALRHNKHYSQGDAVDLAVWKSLQVQQTELVDQCVDTGMSEQLITCVIDAQHIWVMFQTGCVSHIVEFAREVLICVEILQKAADSVKRFHEKRNALWLYKDDNIRKCFSQVCWEKRLCTVAPSLNSVIAFSRKGLQVKSAWCAVRRVWWSPVLMRSSTMGDLR